MQSVGSLAAGASARFWQPLTAGRELSGKAVATLEVKVSYTDPSGTPYNDSFVLTFPVFRPTSSGPGATVTPTRTPTPKTVLRPQLVVTGYETDMDILQPGSRFLLTLSVKNVGSAAANRLSVIFGGGSATGGSAGGTPDAGGGGVSGAGADLSTFAPLNSSNVQSLGNLAASSLITITQALIVNGAANPGAYPMKLSFVYTDERGAAYTDDQVITLLVYAPPQVEVNFYRDPGPIFAGQPNLLPLQVVNLGRKSAILGNLKVTAPAGQWSNNTILVGALDIGGFYTLDATFIPDAPGPVELLVTIDYTDDFNQPVVITRTLSLEVLEGDAGMLPGPDGNGFEPGPGGGGVEPPAAPEGFLQKVWRFLRGLLGFDSAAPASGGESAPPSEIPVPAPKG